MRKRHAYIYTLNYHLRKSHIRGTETRDDDSDLTRTRFEERGSNFQRKLASSTSHRVGQSDPLELSRNRVDRPPFEHSQLQCRRGYATVKYITEIWREMTGPFVNEIEATAEAIVSGYGRTENGTLLSNWKRKPRNEGNGKGEKLDLRGW